MTMLSIEPQHPTSIGLASLATRENQSGQPLKKSTTHYRLSMLRVVIERLNELDHPDTPTRNPIMWTDLPKLDEPLPKFLDDEDAAKFMTAAVRLDPQRRLIVEMLARTGVRIGEFCDLTDNAIVKINETNWLRVPVGKLHTDRYVPLHPTQIELHWAWREWNGPNDTGRLISNKDRPLSDDVVHRIVKACARIAGIGHVHPHQRDRALRGSNSVVGYRAAVVSMAAGREELINRSIRARRSIGLVVR